MSVEIKTKGYDTTQDLIKHIKDNIDEHHTEMLHLIGESIVAEAKSNLQNNTNIDSGTLHASIMILDEGDDFIIVGTNEDYAGYIEYGRGPVRPLKEGGWLHWIDKSTGKDVFAKFANATEPMPFLEPAVATVTLEFPQVYTEETSKLIS